jgi:hypothetical protein
MNLGKIAINTAGALAGLALAAATLGASPARAAVTSITSSSTVLDVALRTLVGPVDLTELPASGSAPPAYSVKNALASYSTNLGPLSLTTGVLVDTASGDTATAEGTASSSLATLDITLDSIFTLTATALSSTSSVDGTPSATGSSTLADLTITAFGSSIMIPLDPSPNDVIFDRDGVTITLNQQIQEIGGEGVTEGITTNAVAISLADSPFVTGHIDISQSMATIQEAAVPEISTWAMMAFGFVGLAFAYRGRRTLTAIAAG